MNYRLRIYPRAEADIEHILHWMVRHSPAGALRWYAAFDEAAANLAVNPHRCGIARENAYVEPEIRQMLFRTHRGRTYRVLFTIAGDEVRLLRVRGPGQRDLQPDEFENHD